MDLRYCKDKYIQGLSEGEKRIASYYKSGVQRYGSVGAYEAHLRDSGLHKKIWKYSRNEAVDSYKNNAETQKAIVKRKQQIALKFVGAISKDEPEIEIPDRQFDVSDEIRELKLREYKIRLEEEEKQKAEYLEYMRENALDIDTRKEKLSKFEDQELRDILEQYTHKCSL